MITLRPYQTAAVQSVYDYYGSGKTGNCLIVLPTGAGKSLCLAAFIRRALTEWPATRIVVLTHVRELIQQDANAILRYWPDAPIGVWSAGLGEKTKRQITVAGIQSVHRVPAQFGGTDLVIIDEAHLLSKRSDTMYGRFLEGLKSYQPALKVIGLTATPYRMDSGLLTEGKNRIFTDVAYEAGVGDLIKAGWLCNLVSRGGATQADLTGVHVRGGEFVAGELQHAMNKAHLIEGAMDEVERLAAGRQHILGFCSGIEHARRCAEECQRRGWAADYVTGEMATGMRDARIKLFTEGRTRILFNAALLTTGFDYPAIDCILMLRPTQSTGLYVQIMGRGLRRHPDKKDTLVLDFAGNVQRHGPIDQIKVKSKREKGEGVSVAPVKECPQCHALIFASLLECPECGHYFPHDDRTQHDTFAADAVVVAATQKPRVYSVDRVTYQRHTKIGRPDSVRVTYHCGIATFDEWLPVADERSYVKKHAVTWFWQRGCVCPDTVEAALAMVHEDRIPAPTTITVRRDGKYWRVIDADLSARRAGASEAIEQEPVLEPF